MIPFSFFILSCSDLKKKITTSLRTIDAFRKKTETSSDLHRIALFRRMFTEKLWNMCQEVKGIEHRYVRTSGCGSSSSQGRCSKLSHDLAVFEAFMELLVLGQRNIRMFVCLFCWIWGSGPTSYLACPKNETVQYVPRSQGDRA